jgi:hypothetical protein
MGVTVAADGGVDYLYIADSYNNLLRRLELGAEASVTAQNSIETLLGGAPGYADGKWNRQTSPCSSGCAMIRQEGARGLRPGAS